jgi:hypothetical protein
MSNEIDVGTLLADQLERLLAKELTREVRFALEERGELPGTLWREAEEMGTTLALAVESAGGLMRYFSLPSATIVRICV